MKLASWTSPDLHRCACGWCGTHKQLALWLRQGEIIKRICPRCGRPAALQVSRPQVTYGSAPAAGDNNSVIQARKRTLH